jgi:opacity protein-like surface antigen
MILLALFVCTPAAARAQGPKASVVGFGGLTFSSSSLLGGITTAPTLGGLISIDLTPNIQAIGEVGRLSDIKPSLYDALDFTGLDLRISAWYGEGGVRFISSPKSALRPYAQATAGFARLSPGFSGLGGPAEAAIATGLAFFKSTEPVLGVGAGVMFEHGRLAIDAGYRYKKITADSIASVLNAGNAYQVNEARFGLGVRF